ELGTRLARDAGATMTEIVSSVKRVTDIIGEITASTREQSGGIGQIGVAVNQLDQMTQQNSALVEESAAAAASLKDQAQQLADAIFRECCAGAVRGTGRSPQAVATPPEAAPGIGNRRRVSCLGSGVPSHGQVPHDRLMNR